MSTIAKTLLLVVSLLGSSSAIHAGAAAGMDLELIKNIKNYVMPSIIADINALSLPRIDYNGGYVEELKFAFHLKSNDSVGFSFDPARNAVIFTAHDISGKVTGKFKQRLLLISARGNFEADFKDGGISIHIAVPLHSQLLNGRVIPKIEVQDFNIAFDTSKIKISIWGGFLADIGDLFIGLFKGVIIRSIASGINTKVPPQLNTAIQSYLVASNGFLPLYNGLAFDFQVPADPVMTNETLGLYLNATFFNQSLGYSVPMASPISDVALDFSHKNLITVDTSRYTIDSLLLTVQKTGLLDTNITQATLGPVYGPAYLNTTFADSMLYGLIAKYGRDQPMALRIDTPVAPNSFFKPGELGLDVTFDVWVYVREELAVRIRVINAEGAIAVNLTDGNMTIQLDELYFTDTQVFDSQLGPLNIDEERVVINWIIEMSLPIINSYLGKGIQLPDEFFGIIRIRDAFFEAMDGYVRVGIVPEFI